MRLNKWADRPTPHLFSELRILKGLRLSARIVIKTKWL